MDQHEADAEVGRLLREALESDRLHGCVVIAPDAFVVAMSDGKRHVVGTGDSYAEALRALLGET
jgi:hypothetical protein